MDGLDISRLAPKCVRLMRPQLFGYIQTKQDFDLLANELVSLVKNNQLYFSIHKMYDLTQIEQVRQSHLDIESRGTSGKLLLQVIKD